MALWALVVPSEVEGVEGGVVGVGLAVVDKLLPTSDGERSLV